MSEIKWLTTLSSEHIKQCCVPRPYSLVNSVKTNRKDGHTHKNKVKVMKIQKYPLTSLVEIAVYLDTVLKQSRLFQLGEKCLGLLSLIDV